MIKPAQAAEVETTFILHKVLFDLDKMPNEELNTGNEMPFFEEYETLDGATFEVYDVSDRYATLKSEGKNQEDSQLEISRQGPKDSERLALGTTADGGRVQFTLPIEDNEQTALLFHESSVPDGIRERATNLVVILPLENHEGPIHLYPKNETERLPFDKELVTDGVSYEIGERISYQINTKVPTNPSDFNHFSISDTADDVLLFIPDSLEVKIGNQVVEDVYTLETNVSGFELDFDLNRLTDFSGLDMRITYDMTLSEEAIPDKDYFNNALLEYDNNQRIARTMVRTGGYRFDKVDRVDPEIKLAGARFVLRNQEDNYLTIENGQYHWVANRDQATEYVSESDGSLEVTGLKDGRYRLVEIEAPRGYLLSNTPISFQVTAGTYRPGAVMNIINEPETKDEIRLPITGGEDDRRLPITRGQAKPEDVRRLPITGETMNIILSVTGIMLIVVALTILSKEGRKEEER